MLLILKEKKEVFINKTISLLQKELLKNNVPNSVASISDAEFLIKKNDIRIWVKERPLSDWDAVFFRKVGKHQNTAYIISQAAQETSTPFVDRIFLFSNNGGKLSQMYKLAKNNISIPLTYFSPKYNDRKIDRAINFLSLPLVVKLSHSRKGAGVFLARTKKEALSICKQNMSEEIILQKFIPNTFDYRILILGKRAAVAEKRIRITKHEFRNNVALGAKEEFIDIKKLLPSIKKIAIEAAVATNVQVAGVDIVMDTKSNPYVLEVNRTPAFTHDKLVSNEISELAIYLASLCHQKK